MTFGKQLRMARTARRMDRQYLGAKTGISAKHIGNIEKGTANPTIEVAAKLASELDYVFTIDGGAV